MGRYWIFAAVMTAAALGACGRQATTQAGSAGTTPEALVAALDPCAESGSAFARLVCATPSLAALDRQIRETLRGEAVEVSSAGAGLLVQNHTRWLETQRVACGVLDPGDPLSAEQLRCLESALRERAGAAREAVQRLGGYTFQSMEINGASAVSAQAAAESGLGEDAPAAIVREIRFPRIDNDASPQARRFNELVAQQPQFRIEDQTEEQVTYRIAYAGPELISVRFDTYQNTLGAAHPENGVRAVTVVMTTGQPLAAGDVFRAGSGWEDFLTRRAVAALTRQFRDYQFTPPAQDVRATATRAQLWLVSEEGLILLLPPLSFGAPHAFGGAEVTIPWRDLRAYLNPQAPAPIRAGA